LKAVRYWLTLGVAVCAAAIAGQPPSRPAAPPDGARTAAPPADPAADSPDADSPAADSPAADSSGVAAPGAASPQAAAPDDDFIEFLGADDVEDAALWAFLNKSAQRKDAAPTTSPQDAKQ